MDAIEHEPEVELLLLLRCELETKLFFIYICTNIYKYILFSIAHKKKSRTGANWISR